MNSNILVHHQFDGLSKTADLLFEDVPCSHLEALSHLSFLLSKAHKVLVGYKCMLMNSIFTQLHTDESCLDCGGSKCKGHIFAPLTHSYVKVVVSCEVMSSLSFYQH